jgi:hypothetical protein
MIIGIRISCRVVHDVGVVRGVTMRIRMGMRDVLFEPFEELSDGHCTWQKFNG